MVRYVGMDVHKQFIEICILDEAGKPLYRGRTSCRREELSAFAAAKLTRTDAVALEATTNTWPVVEILEPLVGRIVVGNPLKTKAIAEAKVKTDKVDAEVLAQLLRCDYLPAVWQPDEATRQLRAWMTHRTALSKQRTRLKNQIQGLLGRLLIHAPFKVLWTKQGWAWLTKVPLPAHERFVLDSHLRQLTDTERELKALDEQLAGIARREPKVPLLMTMPGVNYTVALAILAALGDITRFADGDHAAAYLGLAPSTRQSAKRCYHGHITKAGNSSCRWLLTQSAQHAARHPGPVGAFYRRLAKRKNRNVAITAVARKLVTIAFLMLKNNEPYRYAKPALMRSKFANLKILKPVKQRGALKERKRLTSVYDAAGLPAVKTPDEVPLGERKMLEALRLQSFVTELYPPSGADKPPAKKATARKPRRPEGRHK